MAAYVPPTQGMTPEEFKKLFGSATANPNVPQPPNTGSGSPGVTGQSYGTPAPPQPPTPPQPPATGVGGFTYGTDPAKSQALVQNVQTWNSNPAAHAAEVARTQQVIAERQSKGMDISEQEKHLYEVLKVPMPGENAGVPALNNVAGAAGGFNYTPSSGLQQMPTPPNSLPGMDEGAIRKYVEDQIARKLMDAGMSADQARRSAQTSAGQHTQAVEDQMNQILERLMTGAQQAQSGVQTSYDRMRGLQQDERTLQNVQFDNNNSPFTGKTDFNAGIMNREREITDRQQSEDLGSRIGNINQELSMQTGQVSTDAQTRLMAIQQDLANAQASIDEKYRALQNAAPDERERMFQEIKKDERMYQLMVQGSLRDDMLANSQMQNTDFNQSLASFGANRSAYEFDKSYDLNADQFDRNFDQQKEQQDWANRFNYGNATGQFSNGQQTMESKKFDAQKVQQEWDNAFAQGQFDFNKAQQIWDNNFKDKNFQQSINQFSQSLGVDYARLSQQNQHHIAEMTYKQASKDQQETQRGFESEVMGGLSQFDNAAEASAWLNRNAGEITKQLGQSGFTELKNAIPQFYGADTSQANAKDAASLRNKAVDMASKDARWNRGNTNKEDLINEYMRLLQ